MVDTLVNSKHFTQTMEATRKAKLDLFRKSIKIGKPDGFFAVATHEFSDEWGYFHVCAVVNSKGECIDMADWTPIMKQQVKDSRVQLTNMWNFVADK